MTVWESGLVEPLLGFMKNPADTEAVQGMYRCYSKDEKVQEALEAKLLKNDLFRALYESWYRAELPSLAELNELPEESFGSHYARHMVKNDLSPDFISEFPEKNILSYLWFRAGHVHDIYHVITGYDTSFMGELGLKGFELGQYESPATAAVIGSGLLAVTSVQPQMVGTIFDQITQGYERGKKFPLLISFKWDQEWATPLDELKRKFGIPIEE